MYWKQNAHTTIGTRNQSWDLLVQRRRIGALLLAPLLVPRFLFVWLVFFNQKLVTYLNSAAIDLQVRGHPLNRLGSNVNSDPNHHHGVVIVDYLDTETTRLKINNTDVSMSRLCNV